MAKQNTKQGDERLENVEEALSKTELWIENNQKTLWIILIALLVQAVDFASYYMENENYATALNGDGEKPGFLEIVKDYGSTKAGKLAAYYAGVCYLKQGNYNEAIEYFKKYTNDDKVLAPMSLGLIGDCYLQLGDQQNAVSYYEKATKKSPNEFTTPMYLQKLGMTYEIMGNNAKALDAYKTLKKDFPLSNEAFEINKNIAYLEEKMK